MPLKRSHVRRPHADEKSIRAAVSRIEAAKSPVLVIGAGANRKMTSRMLPQFIEKTGIPFVTTQLGKGVIDETQSQVPRLRGAVGGRFRASRDRAADLIINVGHDVIEKPPFFMQQGGAEVIHINFRSAEVDPVYFPQIEVIGDIANAIWQIKEDILPQDRLGLRQDAEGPRRRSGAHRGPDQGRALPDLPALPGPADPRRRCPPTASSASTTASTRSGSRATIAARQPNTVLLDNALATMGAGLPSAMASAMVYPDRKVMAICGDGGFMMNSQEMETAVRLKLNITVLILNDNSYGMIRWKQANMGFKDWGLTYGNPDFVKYAESLWRHRPPRRERRRICPNCSGTASTRRACIWWIARSTIPTMTGS